ncbi:MAG: patatin-like phospholipase family protein [Bacteroidota bacterium]
MKRALVLSGGGANGAFQFGALKYIEEELKVNHPDFEFDIIAGVSVGALNGTMIAMDKYWQLSKIWNSPNLQKLIFQGSLEMFSILRSLVARDKAILDNSPLHRLLQRYVRIEDLISKTCDLRIGAVSLRDGTFRTLRPRDFDSDAEFQKAILASTSIPLLWAPQEQIETKAGILYDMVDGSIRDTSPLGQVVNDHPDEVIIINCTSRKLPLEQDLEPSKNIFTIARRALVDIAIDEIFVNDLREYLTINDLVKQAKDQAPEIKLYRTSVASGKRVELHAFNTILIEPQVYMGSILDFHPEKVQWRIEQGYQTAKSAYESYLENENKNPS